MRKLLLAFVYILQSGIILGQTYSGGSGTAEDPYLIAAKADLKYLSENSTEWAKHFRQTADITFDDADFQSGGDFYNSGEGFIPIGNSTTNFTGSYDGDGHIISNLYINRSASDSVGFFGAINASRETKDLGIEDADITGGNSTGIFAGFFLGEVTRCYTTGTVNGANNTGGLIGDGFINTVTDCYSVSTVNGAQNTGGLVGNAFFLAISYCYASSKVNGSSNVGGLVGNNQFMPINNSFWNTDSTATGVGTGITSGVTGKTTAELQDPFTFTGWNPNYWLIGDGINNGFAYLYFQNPGGTPVPAIPIANKADLKYLSENSSEWSKHFEQTADIVFDAADFESGGDFYNLGGGFIPIGGTGTAFKGSYNGNGYRIINLTSNWPSSENVGFIGLLDQGGVIENVIIENASVTALDGVGILAGRNQGGTIQYSSTSGSVSGRTWVGGLVGFNEGGPSAGNYSLISQCFSTATVNASANTAGGLVGQNFNTWPDSAFIRNSYATGSVTAAGSYVGGLVGYQAGKGKIENSYSVGSVSGGNMGGLVGYTVGVVSNSFYNSDSTGTAGEGTPATTSEMKTNSTFLSAGWDQNIWNLDGGVNNGYPYLDWENTGGTPLPVELSSFSVKVFGNNVKLEWSTSSEVNSYGFEVERRVFGQQSAVSSIQNLNSEIANAEWETAGFVKSSGNSNSFKQYEFSDISLHGEKYLYRLKQIDNDGKFAYSKELLVNLSTPVQFTLGQNYPNPFNPATNIHFSIPESGEVTLKVYNTLGGEKAADLVNGFLEAGIYNIDFKGNELPSGVYIYKLEVKGKFQAVKKMNLIK